MSQSLKVSQTRYRMPKRRIETREMDAVEAAVASFPEGAAFQDIARALSTPLNTRTLQRRLAKLAKEGKIEKKGKTAGTRYYLLQQPPALDPEAGAR